MPVQTLPKMNIEAAAERLKRYRGRLLTVQDLTFIFQAHRRTVDRNVRKKRFPQPDYRFGNFQRWKFTTILKFIN
jgi:hypothetical protein